MKREPEGDRPWAILAAAALILALLSASTAHGQTRRTDFDPAVHGFKFSNTFQNIFTNEITTSGLCGGMVYSALDFYHADRQIPRKDFRPANGTSLQQHIYFRQVHSIERNIDKWVELGFNPFGARSSEFFRWGLQGLGGGRLEELRRMIDRGQPVPLGLQEYGHGRPKKSHQVLAIGYEMGRFTGTQRNHQWFGEHAEDFSILVYDPNHPGMVLRLAPDTQRQGFYYREYRELDRRLRRDPSRDNHLWRTYFVDMKYTQQRPPVVAETPLGPDDGRARELLVEISTVDDLAGGNDNLDIVIRFDGRRPAQVERNINRGHRWLGDYRETVPIRLRDPIEPASIQSVTVQKSGNGTFRARELKLRVLGGRGLNQEIFSRSGTPLFELSPHGRTFTARNRLAQATPPQLTIVAAAYGRNCGIQPPRSDITRWVSEQCNGRTACTYRFTWAPWGGRDPNPSLCTKQIAIRYRCGYDQVESATVLHRATPQDVSLSCQ